MKKRVWCIALAALLALGMCTPALASAEDFSDKAWEMALVLKDAVGVSFYSELEIEWSDPVYQGLGIETGASLEARTANFSDGYQALACEYEFNMAEQEWDNQGVLVIPDNGVYYVREYSDATTTDETVYEHYADGESTAIGDVSRAYLYFAALGDNTMDAQMAVDPERGSVSYTAGGDGLRLLLETCFPQTVFGCADALDWENITADVRVKVDPYGDNTYIVLTSPALGAALLGQVPGMDRVRDVKLEIEIDIVAIIAGTESLFSDVYEEMHPDPSDLEHFTEEDGPAPQVQPLVEYMRSAYGRVGGGTADTGVSREDAMSAIRDELAGITAGGNGASLSGEDAEDAAGDGLAGITAGGNGVSLSGEDAEDTAGDGLAGITVGGNGVSLSGEDG